MSRPTNNSSTSVWLSAALALTSIISMNFGASWAKILMRDVGANGAVWLRFTAAAIVLTTMSTIGRLNGRHHPPMQLKKWPWLRVAAYSAALLIMNWSIYHAFNQIPIGAGVTIELLGPLALAVIASRRMLDYLWIALALAGVVGLGAQPVTNLGGIGWSLVAGLCWALYIQAGSKLVGPRNIEVLAFTYWVGTLVLAPIALPGLLTTHFTPKLWLAAGLVGFFSAALPYSIELVVMRRVPARLFSILQAMGPAIAAILAWLVIGETLSSLAWLAIVAVIAASVGATLSASNQCRPSK